MVFWGNSLLLGCSDQLFQEILKRFHQEWRITSPHNQSSVRIEAKEGKQSQSSEPQVRIPEHEENKPGPIPGTSKDWPKCSSKTPDAPTTFYHDKGEDVQSVTQTPESNREEINSNPDNTNFENVELTREILESTKQNMEEKSEPTDMETEPEIVLTKINKTNKEGKE